MVKRLLLQIDISVPHLKRNLHKPLKLQFRILYGDIRALLVSRKINKFDFLSSNLRIYFVLLSIFPHSIDGEPALRKKYVLIWGASRRRLRRAKKILLLSIFIYNIRQPVHMRYARSVYHDQHTAGHGKAAA